MERRPISPNQWNQVIRQHVRVAGIHDAGTRKLIDAALSGTVAFHEVNGSDVVWVERTGRFPVEAAQKTLMNMTADARAKAMEVIRGVPVIGPFAAETLAGVAVPETPGEIRQRVLRGELFGSLRGAPAELVAGVEDYLRYGELQRVGDRIGFLGAGRLMHEAKERFSGVDPLVMKFALDNSRLSPGSVLRLMELRVALPRRRMLRTQASASGLHGFPPVRAHVPQANGASPTPRALVIASASIRAPLFARHMAFDAPALEADERFLVRHAGFADPTSGPLLEALEFLADQGTDPVACVRDGDDLITAREQPEMLAFSRELQLRMTRAAEGLVPAFSEAAPLEDISPAETLEMTAAERKLFLDVVARLCSLTMLYA